MSSPQTDESGEGICDQICPMLNADGGLIYKPCELATGHEGRHLVTPEDMGSRFMTMAAILQGSGVFAAGKAPDAYLPCLSRGAYVDPEPHPTFTGGKSWTCPRCERVFSEPTPTFNAGACGTTPVAPPTGGD